MRRLIFFLLLIIFYLLFPNIIDAHELQFTIPDNIIQLKLPGDYQIKQQLQVSEKNEENRRNEQSNEAQDNFYLIREDQSYLLKEYFDPNLIIEIDKFYSLELAKDFSPAISFEYFVDSAEDLSAFDEPVFYISIEGESKQELIFAKTIKQSDGQWQKVILDLRVYDLFDKHLHFYAGNLGDQNKPSSVYIKNLSSQLIVWQAGDQLLLDNQLIQNPEEYIEQGKIRIAENDWPIYQFISQKITKPIVIEEVDGSFTFIFSAISENIFKNHRWFLTCGQEKSEQLIQKNHFLFPQMTITDFWPNFGEEIIINVQDLSCVNSSSAYLEVI
ncbi:MAG: hypothetical protein GX559_01775 [Candidatus Pacebacteria bacterium]|nr:hypothetical protein [Candidatus Paceibacterota bacterium]